MDSLRRQDIELARSTSPEERGRQALEAMRTGIRLKRANLRTRHPGATEEAIEAQLVLWLERDG
jgi:hypothetical protein